MSGENRFPFFRSSEVVILSPRENAPRLAGGSFREDLLDYKIRRRDALVWTVPPSLLRLLSTLPLLPLLSFLQERTPVASRQTFRPPAPRERTSQ